MANGKSLNSLEGNVCSIRDKCKYIYSELYSIFNLKPFRVNYSLNFKHLFSLLQQILMLPQLLLLTGIFCKKKNPNPCYHIKLPDEELSTSCQLSSAPSLLPLTLASQRTVWSLLHINLFCTKLFYVSICYIYWHMVSSVHGIPYVACLDNVTMWIHWWWFNFY